MTPAPSLCASALPAVEPKGAENRKLRQERTQQHAPFRALANKFGGSVWAAHGLCVGGSVGKLGPPLAS
jgi:hypothetical protein